MEVCNNDSLQKLLSNMNPRNCDAVYEIFTKNFAKLQFQMKAIIQDVSKCSESLEDLGELNETGRKKLTELRLLIDKLEICAKDTHDKKYSDEMKTQRKLLANLMKEFKEATVQSMLVIEKNKRDELLQSKQGGDTSVRQRKKVERDGLLKMSSDVTQQLLSISRQLADTTERSQHTLDSLVSSSSTVHGTQSELENTAGTISQSSKLLKKYGRREFTDKLIMFFAFVFFLAVCLYIVQKRLF